MEKIISRIYRLISNKITLIIFAFVLQWLFFKVIVSLISLNYTLISIFSVLNLFLVAYILARHQNPSYKIAWCLVVFIFPLIGAFFYLFYGLSTIPRAFKNVIIKEEEKLKHCYRDNESIDKTKYSYEDIVQFEYLKKISSYNYYENNNIDYFGSGEAYFEAMKQDLKEAKHFIFLEYYIVSKGKLLSEIIEILKIKVKEGVEVYFMYDDLGCLNTLETNFKEKMKDLGIKIAIFNPFNFKTLNRLNNRNHRKITVIDNNIGYMGGVNMADEYVNIYQKYGHWKDSGIRIEGSAVYNLTIMFIQFYNATNNENLDYQQYKLNYRKFENNSLLLPFSDSPKDDSYIGRSIHLDLINKARSNLYIKTPYLVLDYELINSLIKASEKGVDVCVILPHKFDKKATKLASQSNYKQLVQKGVKVYEYLDGFIHSKEIIMDDELALIGTINMDYRSYYLNYECGCLYNDKNIIYKMKNDFKETVNKSKLITIQEISKRNIIVKIMMVIVNIFSSLL